MNIFKALSEGNGRISETNVTSFISYLLDSSNELNNSFFILFLNLIDDNSSSDTLKNLFKIKDKNIRDQILIFSKRFNVTSEPEYPLGTEGKKKQIPDILVRVTSKDINQKDCIYFIIENKISKSAISQEQVLRQFEYFRDSEDFDKTAEVYSILITNDDNAFEKMFNCINVVNERSVWLKWTNHIDKNNSIEAILKKLIYLEQNAEIEPIDPNTQFILKSFIDYLATTLPYRESEDKNYNYNGFKEVDSVKVELEGKGYILKRFSNNMIRIFDDNELHLDIDVRPFLRKINGKYNLEINLFHSTGLPKNTQILGREIIKKLSA